MPRTLVLAIDFVNDIVNMDSPHAKNGSAPEVRRRGIIAATNALTDRARKAGAAVAHVRVGFSPDYRECPRNSAIFSPIRTKQALKLGTWGTEVHPELAVHPGDFDIVKHRVSAFHCTSLEVLMRSNGITRILLAGVSTTGAITSTAREAHDRDDECFIVEECCAARTGEEHAKALELVGRFAKVVSLAEASFD